MYPLLPSMQGMNATVLEHAAAELATLYREDEVSLAEQLVLMELLLARTTTISEEEKAKIEGSLKMYDPLWEEHPKVKKIKAQAREEVKAAKAEARAETEARIKAEEAIQAYNTLRDTILEIVQTRFPELKELAEQRLERISSPDVLKFLLVQMASAANETVARNILHPSAA